MAAGTVRWFNAHKGIGFIDPDGGAMDVFMHVTALDRSGLPGPTEGERAAFEVTKDRGKSAAADLAKLP